MFIQTQETPNPDSLKFVPGMAVSNSGPIEITEKNQSNNELIRNIFSVNGVTGIFLGDDFLSVNKKKDIKWEDIKHIIISLITEFYSSGKKFVIDKSKLTINLLYDGVKLFIPLIFSFLTKPVK
jgi:hypothetical protein